MSPWCLSEVLEATAGQGTSSLQEGEHMFEFISTDTRQSLSGCLFVPLQGARHDAHDHVEAALAQGARASLWARSGEVPESLRKAPLIRVEDTLESLQRLGRYHLRKRTPGCRVVAITGSTGKTTTKDLLACLLSTRFRVLKTPGNYNNDVGVPLTLLQLEPDTEVAVMEIAMRGRGQIRRLAQLLEPEVGVITNIGHSHIELLGSQSAIAEAKGELFESLSEDSLAVVPADSPYFDFLKGLCPGPRVSFSGRMGGVADVQPLTRQQRGLEGWQVSFQEGVVWDFPLPGEHHVEDLAAAWGAARHLGVEAAAAGQALRGIRLSHLRMQRQDLGNGLCVLNDTYNAAPDSMRSALQVLSYASGRKLAVLGDMLELGSYEEQAHRDLGSWLAGLGLDLVLAVGSRSQLLAEQARRSGMAAVLWAPDSRAAAEVLQPHLRRGDTLLLKASRGLGLEKLVVELENWQGDA